jgi:ribonuclease HII
LISYVHDMNNIQVICEHKADVNHPSVSAASILAKVEREEQVEKIKGEYIKYGNVGSGYPSDPVTKSFLRNNGEKLKNSGIFRKTWATWKQMFPEKSQMTLGEF